MSFLKMGEKFVNSTAGLAVGTMAKQIGTITNLETISKVGEKVIESANEESKELDEIIKQKKEQGLLRSTGELLGEVTGGVIGGTVLAVGEVTKNDFIKNTGKGIFQSTTFTGDLIGQVAQGTVDSSVGLITDDPQKINKGLDNLGNSATRTGKAVKSAFINTYENGKDVVVGIKDNDSEKLKKGASNLGQAVVIGALGVGLLDVLDGADISEASAEKLDQNAIENREQTTIEAEQVTRIDTINQELAGTFHEETGVQFETKIVTEYPSGRLVEGVFPVFESKLDVQLPEHMYLDVDSKHFDFANNQLLNQIHSNPELAEQFTSQQLTDIQSGNTPEGYTWHHNEEAGKLQLVDSEVHQNTGHTGGRDLWGGGSEKR